jgi:hypothetical protein
MARRPINVGHKILEYLGYLAHLYFLLYRIIGVIFTKASPLRLQGVEQAARGP